MPSANLRVCKVDEFDSIVHKEQRHGQKSVPLRIERVMIVFLKGFRFLFFKKGKSDGTGAYVCSNRAAENV